MRMPILSRKSFPISVKEISNEGYFSGYGSVFDVLDDWNDVIVRGAFTETLEAKKPVMLWQHNSAEPIGVYEQMREDDIGLWLEGRLLLDVEKGREAYVLLKNRAIQGLSIGFVPLEWEFETREDKQVRIIKKVDLWEVSLVTFPANPNSLVDEVKTVRGLERFLRDAGMSRAEAKAAIAAVKSDNRCDADLDAVKNAAQELISIIRRYY